MINILEETGILSVELGEGWLSKDELLSLKCGDVVKVNKFAGDQMELRYNNHFIASCDLVILDGILGARVSGFTEPPVRHRLPGSQLFLTEVLPLSVRIGSTPFCLSELDRASVGTIISLGIPYSQEIDAEITAAGQSVATGKVIVFYEDFGIRILSTVGEPISIPRERSTGQLITDSFDLEKCKNYDFRRPDKLTRIAVDKIARVHSSLIDSLNSRMKEKLSLKYVDQLAFYETFEALSARDVIFWIGEDNYYSRQSRTAYGSGNSSLSLIEGKHSNNPLSEEVKLFIQNLNQSNKDSAHPLFMAALGELGQKLMQQPLCSLINASWRNAADFDFSETARAETLASIQKIPEFDMIVMVHIGLSRDEAANCGEIESEGLYFIYPIVTLEPALGVLNL